jgi:hypothetical protein
MRIDAAGNVGIGTSSPDYSLEVEGTAPNISVHKTAVDTTFYGYRIMAGPDTLSAWLLNSNTGHVSHIAGYAGWGGFFTFTTNGVERMRIDATGNVLIANTSGVPAAPPGGALYVEGGALKYRGSAGTITVLAPA